uniref:DB domain-containing protein n=1 Tax=Parastrongyloides trichosuri TaxID=131310 RepID=A0A0N4Z4J6_PARTI
MNCKLILFVLSLFGQYRISNSCAANGICATPQLCYPQYGYAQPSCGTCARAYSCGSYGCYRTRARGALSFEPDSIRSRQKPMLRAIDNSKLRDRAILKDRLKEIKGEEISAETVISDGNEDLVGMENDGMAKISPTIARLNNPRSLSEPINPNTAFLSCCMDRKLPDACLEKCNFGRYNKNTLTEMYFKRDGCPIAALSELQFCAARGKDHRACCIRNGVTTTLAGDKCLLFCDQTPGKVTPLDMSYISCFDRFENMKSCFWHDLSRFYTK